MKEQSMKPCSILIVEDHPLQHLYLHHLFSELGEFHLESARDGEEALAHLKKNEFDLVLTDLLMPRMDGVAATRAIRALDGPVSRTPIIALTANADPDDVRSYLEAGMNDVVEKPIKAERMLIALQAALDGVDDQSAAA